jgi:hypothetical protein
MRTILAIALFLFARVALPAEDQRMHLVQPKGVALVLTKLVRANDLFAEFSGKVWVTGTVIGRWSTVAMNTTDKEPDYLLVPDQGSVDQLPYFVLHEPPYFNRYKVRSIELLNGAEALRIAAGEEQVRRLLERRVIQVRMNGRFLIDQYVVGVECDAPWAKALLVKADSSQQVAKYNAVPEGC